jgi:hypothetical protein
MPNQILDIKILIDIMKTILKDGRRYILRFDKGEEVFAKLLEFAATENISAASFNAIGACSEVELGYFNINLKDYRKKPFYEEMEMVSLIGNIATPKALNWWPRPVFYSFARLALLKTFRRRRKQSL